MDFKNFYKGKKVVVTGNTGFKGAWLSLFLDKLGADVTGISLNPPSDPYLYSILKYENVKTHKCDIRNHDALAELIKKEKPDVVFHLAAMPILLQSYDSPLETYMTNVIGTLNVLDASFKAGSVKAVVNVTTDKVYENYNEVLAYKENDRLGGHDPYSSSKACSEILTSAYRDSYYSQAGIGISTARSGNCIGGGDWGMNRLVPNIVKVINKSSETNYFLKGGKVKIRASSIRPWQHVFDVITGYLMLGKATFQRPEEFSGAWNFGPDYNSVRTVKDFAYALAKAYGIDGDKYFDILDEKHEDKWHEDKILILDSIKARAKLGWESSFSFEAMIKETGEWYRRYYERKTDMHEFSLGQLNSYMVKH